MANDQTRRRNHCPRVFGAMVILLAVNLQAAESAIIWVAKEARLFEKHGLDVTHVLIPSSVRTLQAILAGESPIAESAGPAAASARLAGGDVVALAGSVNIRTYYFVGLRELEWVDFDDFTAPATSPNSSNGGVEA